MGLTPTQKEWLRLGSPELMKKDKKEKDEAEFQKVFGVAIAHRKRQTPGERAYEDSTLKVFIDD